jgi:hypothetical protein
LERWQANAFPDGSPCQEGNDATSGCGLASNPPVPKRKACGARVAADRADPRRHCWERASELSLRSFRLIFRRIRFRDEATRCAPSKTTAFHLGNALVPLYVSKWPRGGSHVCD